MISRVTLVGGDQEYLRHRWVSICLKDAAKVGYRVVEVHDSSDLQAVLAGSVFFTDKVLGLVRSAGAKKPRKKKGPAPEEPVEGWSSEDADLILDHHKTGPQDVSLVVVHPGEVTASSLAGLLLDSLPKSAVKVFHAPKPWEEREQATKFLVVEMTRRGKRIDPALAENVINRCGTDLGLVSFEAQKFCLFLDAEGRDDLTAQDASPLVSSLGGGDWEVLKSAVACRDDVGALRAWTDLRERSQGSLVPIAQAVLLPAVTSWAHAASLSDQGFSPEEAAEVIGMHPYRFRTAVLPAASNWGTIRLVKFLKALSDVNPRRGFLNPDLALEAILMAYVARTTRPKAPLSPV